MLPAPFDLKEDGGPRSILGLASAAEDVVESFRPGVVERLGIGYGTVSARNPGIVYVSTSGYRQDGPLPNGPATTSTTWPWAATWP